MGYWCALLLVGGGGGGHFARTSHFKQYIVVGWISDQNWPIVKKIRLYYQSSINWGEISKVVY